MPNISGKIWATGARCLRFSIDSAHEARTKRKRRLSIFRLDWKGEWHEANNTMLNPHWCAKSVNLCLFDCLFFTHFFFLMRTNLSVTTKVLNTSNRRSGNTHVFLTSKWFAARFFLSLSLVRLRNIGRLAINCYHEMQTRNGYIVHSNLNADRMQRKIDDKLSEIVDLFIR